MQIAAGAVNEKCSCQSCITCMRAVYMYMFVVLDIQILVLPKRSEEYLYNTDVAILASSICL